MPVASPASAPRPAVPPAGAPRASAPAKASPISATGNAKAGYGVSDELAAALAQLAAESAPVPVTSAPFITAMQREADARERRKAVLKQFAWLGLAAAAAAIALHFTVTRVILRTPSPSAIEAHLRDVPAAILRLYSTVEQPLQTGAVSYTLTDRVDWRRLRYAVEVTLELRKPLYVPANTNGTVAYRQLQESLHSARERDLKFNLFPPSLGPKPPDLPQLLQVSHRVGDRIVVRAPFEAKRLGWPWRLEPVTLGLRTVNRSLLGSSIERFAAAPYVVFGAPGSLTEIRQRMRLARDYVIAVTKAIQLHADFEAVIQEPMAPAPPPNPSLADRPAVAETAATVGPEAGSPGNTSGPGRIPVPVEPNRPAFDPNAPAIEEPPN